MLVTELKGRDNGFGILRLTFASLVIVDHAYPLGGFGAAPTDAWFQGQESLRGISVAGFFAISGYLIAKSAASTDPLQFAWRRFLRIFPAFWVVLLITALLVAPLLWIHEGQSLTAYFTEGSHGPWSYLRKNWLLRIGQSGLHDLLRTTTPYGLLTDRSTFNGSLWTLILEARCYILVGVLAGLGVFRTAPRLTVAVTVLLFTLTAVQAALPDFPAQVIPWLKDPYTLRLTSIFLLGSCAALYADRLPIDRNLALLATIGFSVGLLHGGYLVLGYPSMVYLILYAACRLPAPLKAVGSRNDYSYGIYIYGFVVQQVLAYIGVQQYGFGIYLALTFALSLGLAWLSWHLVERPALGLKDRGPGRGIAAFSEQARGFIRTALRRP